MDMKERGGERERERDRMFLSRGRSYFAMQTKSESNVNPDDVDLKGSMTASSLQGESFNWRRGMERRVGASSGGGEVNDFSEAGSFGKDDRQYCPAEGLKQGRRFTQHDRQTLMDLVSKDNTKQTYEWRYKVLQNVYERTVYYMRDGKKIPSRSEFYRWMQEADGRGPKYTDFTAQQVREQDEFVEGHCATKDGKLTVREAVMKMYPGLKPADVRRILQRKVKKDYSRNRQSETRRLKEATKAGRSQAEQDLSPPELETDIEIESRMHGLETPGTDITREICLIRETESRMGKAKTNASSSS